jgi:hypothetical protein
MCRHDGLAVSATSVLRLLRGEGLLLEANYQRERRQLAARRKAAFAVEPTAPNQVWQLDFTEFETTTGGTSVGIALGELAERSAGEAFGLGEGKFDRGDGVVLVRRRRDVPAQLVLRPVVPAAGQPPRAAGGGLELARSPAATPGWDRSARWRTRPCAGPRAGGVPAGR